MDYNNILRQVVNELTINGEESSTNQNNEDENLPSMDDDTNEDTNTSEEETQNNDSTESEDDQLPSMDDAADNSNNDDTSETSDSSDEMEDENLPSMDDDSDDLSSSDSNDMPESNTEDSSEETTDGEDTGGDELPSMDDDGGDNSDGSEVSNDDNSENEESENGEESEQENPIEKIKKIEEELFSNLSDDQMAIKNAELKGQFMTLYSTIGATLVRINDIPKSEDNIDILKFITDKLLELREMIDFNITKAYKTRSYIENTIIYQQCIATLNAISEIISNLPNISPEKNPGVDELQNEENEKGVPVENDNTSHNISNISDISVSDYHEESYSYNSLF